METTTSAIENDTSTELLRSWERPRTSEEIHDFIARHENELEVKQARSKRPQIQFGKIFFDLAA